MNGIINSSLEATLKDLLYGMGWSVTRQLISLGMVGAAEIGPPLSSHAARGMASQARGIL